MPNQQLQPAPFSLSVRAAAQHVGVSKSLMYRWTDEGKFQYSKIGGKVLILRESLEQFIKENQVIDNAPR